MPDDELSLLADLLRKRNKADLEISSIVGRPVQIGHIGEFIASRVFDIRLHESATHKGSDGHFTSGAVAEKTVNVKWYGKWESVLDVPLADPADYLLVMTGPKGTEPSSKNSTRPWLIDYVFLFHTETLVAAVRQLGVKVGIATSVRKVYWEAAELYPEGRNPLIVLSDDQREVLKLFASP